MTRPINIIKTTITRDYQMIAQYIYVLFTFLAGLDTRFEEDRYEIFQFERSGVPLVSSNQPMCVATPEIWKSLR